MPYSCRVPSPRNRDWAAPTVMTAFSTMTSFSRAAEGVDPEELELEMIDLGVDEFYSEEDGITVYAPYESFGAIQKWLDDKGFEIVSGESVRIPSDVKELDAEGRESVEKLVEKLEEDDDVVNVYHTMKDADEE